MPDADGYTQAGQKQIQNHTGAPLEGGHQKNWCDQIEKNQRKKHGRLTKLYFQHFFKSFIPRPIILQTWVIWVIVPARENWAHRVLKREDPFMHDFAHLEFCI